ncbi:hypothetical protein DPMN_046336 [Dreissena polymorpha]|uniref:SUEL-type lectin domain-containing protein n=3 Tax=Dreissena polymorpha TaxID=45954 RepID=A0A9D4D7P4_DREPO|nr:hypothetical protein DPMN_046336 [Dreissena polymorpha]
MKRIPTPRKLFFTALVTLDTVISLTTYNASACFGSDGSSCNTLVLDQCKDDERIYVSDQKYGVKVETCNNKNKCLTPGSGCCAYKAGDCMESLTQLHSYDLYRTCSGQSTCKTQVGRQSNIGCNGGFSVSTYATISYSCITESIDFCKPSLTSGESVNIIFDKRTSLFTAASYCSCNISSSQALVVKYVDIRMATSHTEVSRTECASAWFESAPPFTLPKSCDPGVNDDMNFVYQTNVTTGFKTVRLGLNGLYIKGANDSPSFVWIVVTAINNANVDVKCAKSAFDPTLTSPAIIPTTPTTITQSNISLPNSTNKEDGGSSNGAIIGGVVSAVIVLMIIAGVLFYVLVYKRRGCPIKRIKLRRGAPDVAVTNMSYKSHGEEYAEIGFVPDISPVENPSYQERVTGTTALSTETNLNDYLDKMTSNGHTYQNTGGVQKSANAIILPQKSPRPPGTLAKIRQQTSRFVALFKKPTDNQLKVSSHPRISDVSTGSYDHIRAFNKVDISLPIANQSHMYSHTNTQQTFDLNRPVEVDSKSAVAIPVETKQKEIERELSAVHVGDQYIEFTFDSVADDKKVHFTMGSEIPRIDGPKRQPPSPHTSPNFIINSQTVETPKYSMQKPVKDKDVRMFDKGVVKGGEIEENQENGDPPAYDYADTNETDKANEIVDEPGAVYEDVDADNQLEKDEDKRYMRQDSQGYLAPVSRHSDVSSDTKHMYVNRLSDSNLMGSNGGTSKANGIDFNELQSKLLAGKKDSNNANPADSVIKDKAQKSHKLYAKGNEVITENENKVSKSKEAPNVKRDVKDTDNKSPPSGRPSVVKSNNTAAKDYEHLGNVKAGVLNMKLLFENKESDSDSSRQSSPRGNAVSESAGRAKTSNIKT